MAYFPSQIVFSQLVLQKKKKKKKKKKNIVSAKSEGYLLSESCGIRFGLFYIHLTARVNYCTRRTARAFVYSPLYSGDCTISSQVMPQLSLARYSSLLSLTIHTIYILFPRVKLPFL